jgi:carbon-monoxide dehydrogenase large subunit
LQSSRYEELLLGSREARGQDKLTGVGVSIYTETTGFAPGFVFANLGLTIGGYDSATLRMDSQGKLLVMTGAFTHGQGFNTAVSQICADELGLSLEDISVFQGDTHSSPYGHGTFGSRTVAVAGTAAALAARQLAEKILQIGAHLLKKEKVDLSISAGFVVSRSEPEKRVPIAQVAASAYVAHHLPQGTEPGLESTVFFNPLGLATSYAAHVCQVEVDSQSGLTRVLKYFSVHDCGNQINPMIVEGQIHGGIVQAIGATLLEEVLFNDEGQLLTDSFMSYLLPTAEDVPLLLEVDSITTPTPINPLGAKGIGESGTIIAPPAIANAISDAIRKDVNEIPATPERIWRLMRQDH